MEPMMNSRHDARVKILALEKMRVVETNLIKLSYPLIRRLEMDLEQHHGQPLAADLREHLFRGESWWQPARAGVPHDDPRIFPIVHRVSETIQQQHGPRWSPGEALIEGVSYFDLIEPLRKLLQQRTDLARIAGVD